jgi:hypothetical protein
MERQRMQKNEYTRVAESIARECLEIFCNDVVRIYGNDYLRKPTVDDANRIMKMNEGRGFPGVLGSLDCMHWSWKNCPKVWQGHHSGKEATPTVVLEAVASYDLWFWHAFFGSPGALNDINILDRSPLVHLILKELFPIEAYSVNGTERRKL